MTSRPPATLDQNTAPSKKAVAATVTGVDESGQLFRDSAQVVFLKGQKCVYRSKVKPSSDNALLIEIRTGAGPSRSDAKVRSVSPATRGKEGFRVTIELERPHSSIIEAEDEEEIPEPQAAPVERNSTAHAFGGATSAGSGATAETASTVKDIMAPESEGNDVIADIVRSIVASETVQWKQELQGAVANQVQVALQQPLKAIEAKIEQQLQNRPAITEESVRKIAAKAAESSQIEQAAALQKSIAETVRAAVGSVDEAVRKRVEARLKEQSPERPALTEDAVRRLATQVAEATQLEWASSKLQKIIAEAVRSAMAADSVQRKAQTAAQVSAEIEASLRGPIAAQLDANIEKAVAQGIERYLQAPTDAAALQKLVTEAVRKPLEAEYGLRAQQIQTVVSREIAAAVHGPVASQMDEMLKAALEQQRAEYLRTPPPITEDTLQIIATRIAEHPQLLGAIDSLTATLSARWAAIARSATANAQDDIGSRIAASERLTNQVITDIQRRLDSFSAEMNRILGSQEAGEGSSQPPGEPESDKRFRELLQSTGSNFEREMKSVLQKIFGKH